MNLFELFMGILPVSSAVLSVIASIATAILTKKLSSNDKKAEKLEIQINGKKINIENFDEKEVLELLEKLGAEKKREEKKEECNKIN